MSFPRYPIYKASGVEWLGEVPEHWEVWQSRRLFSLRSEGVRDGDKQLTASQQHGVIYQEDFLRIEGRRVVQVIIGADILKHVEPGDFVISMRSFQGGIELCELRGCISSAYVMLVPCDRTHCGFYSYLLKSRSYIQALQTTTNLVRDGQALRYGNFTQVNLPLPPLEEQTAITAFLDHETAKIDELVAEQERLIELLKEKRQAVISHAVTKGLNPDAPMKDSGIEWLGEVPEHWEVVPFKHRCSRYALYGANMSSDEYVSNGVRFLRTTDISENGELEPDGVFISPEVAREYLLKDKDILISRSGTIGRAFVFAADVHPECAYAGYLVRFVPTKQLNSRLFFYFTKSVAFSDWLQTQLIFSTIGNVNGQKYAQCRLTLPPIPEQITIAAFLDHETAKFTTLTTEANRVIDLLKERRTALISAAVTGQIDVRNLVPVESA